MSENTILSIIIVTFNSLPALEQSLVSLTKSHFKNFEIIVVDNNSTDNSIDTVLTIFSNAKIIRNKSNVGFAKACNIGAVAAKSELLLFYNPDLEIDDDSIGNLIRFMESGNNIGVVSGRMRFPDNSFQSTCRNFPNMTNIFLSRGSVISKFIPTKKIYTLPDFTETTEVDAVAGTFMAVSKENFMRVGMFDERFFMYMEDTDLSYRLKLMGCQNYFFPEAGGVHLWGKGSTGGRVLRNYYHHLSVWKYFLKHFSGGFSILFLPIMLIGNFIISIVIPKK